eukprot:2976958-Amphidinium_carterae.1
MADDTGRAGLPVYPKIMIEPARDLEFMKVSLVVVHTCIHHLMDMNVVVVNVPLSSLLPSTKTVKKCSYS